jgi:FMN phosphatase YigB (HAD superfamily)
MSSSTKLLKQYIEEVVKGAQPRKQLWVFDFDDTLVKTDAVTHVTHADGSKVDMTPGQFAVYEKQPGDTFDYSDFERLVNPRAIWWTNRILRNVYDHHGSQSLVVLSARHVAWPIEQFMREIGLGDVEVVALNSSDPLAKSAWIDARIKRDGLWVVEFFDDSHKNVAAVRELQHLHPEVQIKARHIVHTQVSSLHA